METNTLTLAEKMQSSAFNLQAYLKANKKEFVEFSPYKIWQEVVTASGMSKSAIIRESGISYAFFYDIINGKKMPSRDKVLRLAFAMHLSVTDCDSLLSALHLMPLKVYSRRDNILLYALIHKLSVDSTSCLLEDCAEAPLK